MKIGKFDTKEKVLGLRKQGLSYRKIKEQVSNISLSSIGNIITEVKI